MSSEQDIGVPDHTILSRLGKGGMATVYLAREERLGRLVALKVIDERFDSDPQFRKRFEREARTAAGLTHANIVPIYQYGFTHEGRPFLSMAYLDGGSLRDRLRQRGPLPLDEALAITRQVAQGLQAAHTRSIVHRDLKPDNVMFQGDTAMLTDFGIAKVLDAATELTGTGVNPGTVKYFSPEQAFERPVDQRSDIYTLGVVLYEMLTGHMPIEADSVVTFMMRIAHQPPEPLPPALRGLQPFMDVLLVKDPDQRLATCAEVVAVIQAMERNWARFGTVDRLTDGIVMGRGAATNAASAPTAASDQVTLLMPPAAAAAVAPVAPTEALARTEAMPPASAPVAALAPAGAPPRAAEQAAPAPRTAVSGRPWLLAAVAALALLAGGWFVLRPATDVGAGMDAPVATDAAASPALAAASPAEAATAVAAPGRPANLGTSQGSGVDAAPAQARQDVPAAAVSPALAGKGMAAPEPAARPQPIVGDVRVLVNTLATVRIDGSVRGESSPARPLVLHGLPSGSIEIELRAPGYRPASERVFVAPGDQTDVRVDLRQDVDALVSGRWEGRYGYRDGRPPVPVAVEFRVEGGELSGAMVETQTFGSPGAGALSADLAGSVNGRAVRFVKTYDGSGGQTHSVNYEGMLDDSGRTIRGVWRLQQLRGTFSLERR